MGEAPTTARRVRASSLLGTGVRLNGKPLKNADDGTPPPLVPVAVSVGDVHLPPHSIAFVRLSDAKHAECMGQRPWVST